MIPIDTYAALVSISRPGRHPEYHILQLCIITRKVATEKRGTGGSFLLYGTRAKNRFYLAKQKNVFHLTIKTLTTMIRRCIDASPSMAALVTGHLAHHDVVERYARVTI